MHTGSPHPHRAHRFGAHAVQARRAHGTCHSGAVPAAGAEAAYFCEHHAAHTCRWFMLKARADGASPAHVPLCTHRPMRFSSSGCGRRGNWVVYASCDADVILGADQVHCLIQNEERSRIQQPLPEVARMHNQYDVQPAQQTEKRVPRRNRLAARGEWNDRVRRRTYTIYS